MTEFLFLFFLLLSVIYFNFLVTIIRGLDNLNSVENLPVTKLFKVSVIIPFRNESEHLLSSIESFKAQSYPFDLYEVLFINDDSNDNYKNLLSGINLPANIKFLDIPENFENKPGKKRGVIYGVSQAKGEIILGTDADCSVPPEWIKTMVNQFDDLTGFVAGPVKFYSTGDYFTGIQQLEFAGLILSGAGLIGSNTPLICSAANIAYRKELFIKAGQFEDDIDLVSGDDEFLMRAIASKTGFKVKFAWSSDALVVTNPNKSIKDFYNQRKRWASKSLFYENKTLILKLTGIYLLFLLSVIFIFLSITGNITALILFVCFFVIKNLLEYNILKRGQSTGISEIKPGVYIFAALLHIPYILISAFSGVLGNIKWKERVHSR